MNQDERPPKTRDRILQAATECFARSGYERTNLREIAKQVGIREPSIYRHFESKEELYRQVLYTGLAPVAESLLGLTDHKAGPKELVEVPVTMLEMHARNPHVASLLQQAVSMPLGELENAVLTEWLDKLLITGKQALMRADYDSPDEIEVSLRILNLFNLCIGYFTNGSMLRRLCDASPDDPEVLERQKSILRVTSKAWVLSS